MFIDPEVLAGIAYSFLKLRRLREAIKRGEVFPPQTVAAIEDTSITTLSGAVIRFRLPEEFTEDLE